MMLIFLLGFVFAVPVIHAHYNKASVEHAEKEIGSEVKKCPICTFLTHHHQDKYLISVHQPLATPVRSITANLPEFIVCIFISPLQGLTNKGPPLFQKRDIALV